MSGDRGATDARKGPAEDELKGFPFDSWMFEVVAKVVKDGPGHIGGEWPCLVTGPRAAFSIERINQASLRRVGDAPGMATRGSNSEMVFLAGTEIFYFADKITGIPELAVD